MSGHRAIGPGVVPSDPSQSAGAGASRDEREGSVGSGSEPPQRDFNRDLAMAVRAALTGRARESATLDFSPELDPLISQYRARSDTPTERSDVPEVPLAPVGEPADPTPSWSANAQWGAGEARTSPSALQSPLLAVTSPASELAPEASAEFPVPQQSIQSALNSHSNYSELRSPSSSLRFPLAGDRGHFLLTIDNTILAADKAMHVADDAMRAAEAPAAPHVTTQPSRDRAVQPRHFKLRPALLLGILFAAALALFLVLAARNLTFGTGILSRDRVRSLAEPRLQESALPGAPASAEMEPALPRPDGEAATLPAAATIRANVLLVNQPPVTPVWGGTAYEASALTSASNPLPHQDGEERHTSTLESEASLTASKVRAVAPSPEVIDLGASQVATVPPIPPEPSGDEKNTGAAIPALPLPTEKPAQKEGQNLDVAQTQITTETTAQAASDPQTAGQSSISADEIKALRERAVRLLSAGDIAAARLLFQRAAQADDARACLFLGATYDPMVLERLGIRGVTADPALARTWYEKAKALGSDEASKQVDIITQWMSADHQSPNHR